MKSHLNIFSLSQSVSLLLFFSECYFFFLRKEEEEEENNNKFPISHRWHLPLPNRPTLRVEDQHNSLVLSTFFF